jgi:hypothetical protein
MANTESRIRVVIKLEAAEMGVAPDNKRSNNDHVLSTLRAAVQGAPVSPYFKEAEGLRAALTDPFNRYFFIDARDAEAAAALAHRIAGLDGIEEAYVESGPTEPPVTPDDDPRSSNQGYLDAAPDGIDARWAWGQADGAGVLFVDLEQGWMLNHEDLAAKNITIISGLNQAYQSHGTSVLGEIVAVDNQLGGIGIAPAAAARVVSQWRDASTYGTAAAILSAASVMGKGDVLLLEAQTPVVNGMDKLPVEVETAVFDAIRYVVDQGIVVIEAGGNGGNDLDNYQDANNRQRLNRNSADFRDSGAIIVGAASAAAPHARLSFSNHGSRIDCYAWGERIFTTNGSSTTSYTSLFNGTSGASPMVAGAAVLLQSWRKKADGKVFDPSTLRGMLSSTTLNTPSQNPAADRIGVMPNLRAILESEIANSRFRIPQDKYLTLLYILFGVIDDSSGVAWIPGKGPVPIDPGWGKREGLSVAKRDLLASLAAHELSSLVSNPAVRTTLSDAANAAMRASVEQIARGPQMNR